MQFRTVFVTAEKTPRNLKTLKRHNKTDDPPEDRDKNGIHQWEAVVYGQYLHDTVRYPGVDQVDNVHTLGRALTQLKSLMKREPNRWYRLRFVVELGYKTTGGWITTGRETFYVGPWCPEKGIVPDFEMFPDTHRFGSGEVPLLPVNLPSTVPYPHKEGLLTLGEDETYGVHLWGDVQDVHPAGERDLDDNVERDADVQVGERIVAFDEDGNEFTFEVV